MLLITDRGRDGIELQKSLGSIEPCQVIPLHQAFAFAGTPSIVICDLALYSAASIDLFNCALARFRKLLNVPIVWLSRASRRSMDVHARKVGVTSILPFETPTAQLLASIKRLISTGPPRTDDAPVYDIGPTVGIASAALVSLFDAAREDKPISVDDLDRGGEAIVVAIGRSSVSAWLDFVWSYDDVTYQHCLLVAGLVAAFALKLGLSHKSQHLLSQAALLHDIGKARIPHDILNKTGPLTVAEMDVMRTHPTIGHDILSRQAGIDPLIMDVVRHHHEFIDGSGYPDRLQDFEITEYVRLTTICDIYAALIERRSYKEPMPPEAAIATLVHMRGKLDQGLVGDFRRIVGV